MSKTVGRDGRYARHSKPLDIYTVTCENCRKRHKIAEMALNNFTNDEIADEAGISLVAVGVMLTKIRSMGFKIHPDVSRGRAPFHTNEELMRTLIVAEKRSTNQIAKLIGCSPSTVSYWRRKFRGNPARRKNVKVPRMQP